MWEYDEVNTRDVYLMYTCDGMTHINNTEGKVITIIIHLMMS